LVKAAMALTLLLCAGTVALAQEPQGNAAPPAKRTKVQRPAGPLNVPPELSPPQEVYAAFPDTSEDTKPAEPAAPSACQIRLGAIATFRPIPVLIGPGDCGATDAVVLDAVTLADKTKIPLTPPATLRCTMAEAIAHWVREDVAMAAQKLGSPLRGLDNYDSYECRGRNRVRGATISEHGRANALDVRGIKLANGQVAGLTDVNVDKAWREGMKASACGRFSTVLGPGSDGYHEEHIHLDLAERRNNYKTCQWDVREPPPPGETANAPAEGEEADAEGAVPLPRPRPSRQIEAAIARHGAASRFDGTRSTTPQ
jgi:hypothetical protein